MNLTVTQRKISKTKINFWQNVATCLFFLAATVTAFTNIHLHKWVGLGMGSMVLLHLALHWQWLAAMSRRFTKKMPRRIRFKLILDYLLLAVFLLLIFSGIIVSLIYAPGVTAFHNACFYLFTGLTSLHLALNWRWILSNGRRVFTISTISRQNKPIIPET